MIVDSKPVGLHEIHAAADRGEADNGRRGRGSDKVYRANIEGTMCATVSDRPCS